MTQEKNIEERKIPVSELIEGMYVCRLDKAWTDSPFLFQGFLIENQELIQQLKQECKFVYIDEAKQNSKLIEQATAEKSSFSFKNFFGRQTSAEPEKVARTQTYFLKEIVEKKVALETITPPKKLVSFEQEVPFAKQTHAKFNQLMQDFTAQVKEGGTIDILIARQVIYDSMASVLRSPDALMLVTRLKNKHKSVWQRSMNDCVLAISLGRYLNLNENDLITLGLAALLHDIGNLKISKQAVEQAENKRELIKTHTRLGYDILISSPGVLGEIVADVAYSHHEQLDGFGFPRGLHGEQISPYTRMVSIVDMYNTLTTDTPHHTGMTHYEAMTLMLSKANSHLDETLLHSFNQCIGTYPIGCMVEMSTGEIAMVVEVNPEHKLRPKIMLLTDANKQKCDKTIFDLADTLSKDGKVFAIKAIVRAEKYGINL